MAVTEISPIKYGELLAKARPKVIETREEFNSYVAMMERLDRRAEAGEPLSPEEQALLALLERLVKDYDDRVELPDLPPHKIVLYLMEHKGLRQADLLPVFGSRSVASDVLNGRRAISKTHARKLAGYFHLSADVFI
ncbi:MAG: helix-turn-helix domain-containing protein [Bryobacteraceae bacterium]